MSDQELVDRWLGLFPAMKNLSPEHFDWARGAVHFLRLEKGDIAYELGGECENYLMCMDGQTRVFKTSPTGREILIYQVGAGGTCVLTTQCLFAGGTFPAESIAETGVDLAAIPAPVFHQLVRESAPFREFVLNDYGSLLRGMISLIDEIAFNNVEQRLMRRLLVEADDSGVIGKTHQQLASDLGTVREVVSRHLSDWERAGWIETSRGAIVITDRPALAGYPSARAR